MEITGSVKLVNEIKQITPTLRKGELVVTTEENYPQTLMIEFVNDRADLLNTVKVGDRVTVAINLRGREWTSPQNEVKYFVSLSGWRITAAGAPAGVPPTPGSGQGGGYNAGSGSNQGYAPNPAPSSAGGYGDGGFGGGSSNSGPGLDDDLPF